MTQQLQKQYTYNLNISAIHRLRVNVKSLSAEARIIRQEEKRADIMYAFELHDHRVRRLREESRYAQLALGYIRGRTYSRCEQSAKKKVNLNTLQKKITKFTHLQPTLEQLAYWLAT